MVCHVTQYETGLLLELLCVHGHGYRGMVIGGVPYNYTIIICLRSLSKFTTVICKKQGSYREMEYAV